MSHIFRKTKPFSLCKVLAVSTVLIATWIADDFYFLKRSSQWTLNDSTRYFIWDLIVVSAWSWVLVRGQKGRLSFILSGSTSSCLYGWLLWIDIIKSCWRIAVLMLGTSGLTKTILWSLVEGNSWIFSWTWKFALFAIWRRSPSISKATLRPT